MNGWLRPFRSGFNECPLNPVRWGCDKLNIASERLDTLRRVIAEAFSLQDGKGLSAALLCQAGFWVMQLGSLSLLRIKLSNTWNNSRVRWAAHSSVPSDNATDYFIPLNVSWEVPQDICQFLTHSSSSAEAKDREYYSPHGYHGPSGDILALFLVKSCTIFDCSAAYKTAVWEEQANVHFSLVSVCMYPSMTVLWWMSQTSTYRRCCPASGWLY